MKAYIYTHTHTHTHNSLLWKGNNRILESLYDNILLKYLPLHYSLENNIIKTGRTAILHRVFKCVCVFTWAYISALGSCETIFITIIWTNRSKVQSRVPFFAASCPCATLISLLVTEQGRRQLDGLTETSVFQRGLKRREETDTALLIIKPGKLKVFCFLRI